MGKEIIGLRIKEFREERGFSLEELAERAGLTTAQLTAIEDEGVAPALGLLVKVARVLGFRLGTFIDDELTVDPHIVRRADRELEKAADSGHTCSTQHYYPLGRGKADRHMEPFFVELSPCGGVSELSSHEGEEFIFVRSGKVKLIYGKKEFILDEGDTMFYNSVVPHWVGSATNDTAKIMAVVYVPF